MTPDPTIRAQTYQYFLQEAPELLQALEEGLLSLRENWGINQVNNLMRATHTLKGAATSMGLDTIARIAHSLEDIFKALCQPDLSLDPEVEALLFEALECLRLPLMAELTQGSINDAEVLNRTAAVFALLQDKLGDCFGREPYLPTSSELGFDLPQSLFEVGVTQRLEQIATSLTAADPESVAIVLRTQAEVLLGLAESLNLCGFGAIAQSAIAALDCHPEQAVLIAQTALADFQAGQAAVLAGDRAQGGEPSIGLQQFAVPVLSEAALPIEDFSSSLLESIWGNSEPLTPSRVEPGESAQSPSNLDDEPIFSLTSSAFPLGQSVTQPQKETPSASPTVRVGIKHLDDLNYAVGELVSHQNRQMFQTEQLQTVGRTLLTQVKRHRSLLAQLQAHNDRSATRQHSTQISPSSKSSSRRSRKGRSNGAVRSENNTAELIQSLLDQTVQLSETAETVHLLSDQANQLLEKQHQLLTSTQNALIEARMLPLSEIFGRFPHMLHQLETLQNKQIALKLQGSEVLVDKAVAEKLFDPLLHLVRNAFDHGIEPAEVRQQRGKPQKGQMTIAAAQHGRQLVIEVHDDGNGLDFDQIRQRAIERQLLSIDQAHRFTQEQLVELLFEPGFSTTTQVSDISGRGVGLDVVRNQVRALQGKVTVQSQLHQGTTFILQIPLNLTIAQLLVCKANSKSYALLDDTVEQILIPRSTQIQERNGGRFLRWGRDSDETLIPIFSLTTALDYESPNNKLPTSVFSPSAFAIADDLASPIILIRCSDHHLGLEVDQLMGEQKLVIRPLGTVIQSPQYVQGASTLADGQLALVIDAATLLKRMVGDKQDSGISDRWANGGAETLPPQSIVPAQLPPEFSPRRGTRILIVDDSITTRQSLVLTLEKAGYQVFQAQDGQEGLDCFHQHPDIQLVVCDIEMPKMNGFEFLTHRQQIPALADIPVLILSSRSDEKHRLLASQLGAAVYMLKPFMEQKLLAIVTRLLEQTPASTRME